MRSAPTRKLLALRIENGDVVLGTREMTYGVTPKDIDSTFYVRFSAGIGVSVNPVAWRMANKEERAEVAAQRQEDANALCDL
jgi:hypothetical protein